MKNYNVKLILVLQLEYMYTYIVPIVKRKY